MSVLENNKRTGLNKEMLFTSKVIVLVRHGDVDVGPEDNIYTRDKHMPKEEIVHLSPEGRSNMRDLAEALEARGINPRLLWTSPQTRAVESAQAFNLVCKISPITVSEDIDEIDSPNAYLAGIKMKELAVLEKDTTRQEEIATLYSAETMREATERVMRAFDKMKRELNLGEAGVLVSHGHPLSLLVNKLLSPEREFSSSQELRASMYCPKGNAIVVAVASDDTVLRAEFLRQVDRGEIY